MSIATDLATFIQQVGDHVFIEAEGKPSRSSPLRYNQLLCGRPHCGAFGGKKNEEKNVCLYFRFVDV